MGEYPETELEMVERHARRGEEIIARQHALVARLASFGHSTVKAENLLITFQEIQIEHLNHLARLKR